MTTEMIDKGVTSFRFNERKKRKKYLIGFLIDFNFCRLPRNDVRLGSQCSCHVRSSVNYVCVWSTKKLTMPAYCVAANCNNLQTTPGITMHELLLSQPAARRKWIKLIQFKQAFLLRHITPICVVSTSVSVISQNHGIPHVKADTMFRYSFKILPDRLKLIRLYPCGSLGQSISVVFRVQVGQFAATPQSDVAGIWSHDLGVMAMLSVQQKMPFFVHL